MGSENIEASAREVLLEVTQIPLSPKQGLIFEALVDGHNPRKRPKFTSDNNEIVAAILRESVLKGEYPFPEEKIKRALEFKDKSSQATDTPQKNPHKANSKAQGSQGKKNGVINILSPIDSTQFVVDLTGSDSLEMESQDKNIEILQVSNKNKRVRKKRSKRRDNPVDVASTVPVIDLTDSDVLEISQYDEDIEIHKDKIVCGLKKTLPPYLLKYWRNRYNLFSRYNEGCLIDEEGWFSVTPELVARQIANRMTCDVIIDAFCGVGGNSIQFAHTCKRVIAIDNNPTRLAFAKHNAKVYGVDHKIEFILGDFFELASTLKADAIFLSPPWGGPAYNTVPTFDIHTMMPFSGVKLFKLCASITPNIGYFLPRNTDYNQLACLATPIGSCEVEEAYSSHKFIAITAYYGNIVS